MQIFVRMVHIVIKNSENQSKNKEKLLKTTLQVFKVYIIIL